MSDGGREWPKQLKPKVHALDKTFDGTVYWDVSGSVAGKDNSEPTLLLNNSTSSSSIYANLSNSAIPLWFFFLADEYSNVFSEQT